MRETEPEALARELREELGMDLTARELVYIGEFSPEGETLEHVCYYVIVDRHAAIMLAKWEILAARWFRVTDLPSQIDPIVRPMIALVNSREI